MAAAPLRAGELPPALPRLRRVESRFTSRHGHNLCVHAWEPEVDAAAGPVAIVLLAHGYTNYIGSFFDWKASLLSAYGLLVFGVDHYAHGRSDGLPAYIPDFGVLVDDFQDYATALRARHPGLPLFAYGESMGGAVAIQVSRRAPALFAGLLLFAPMAGFDARELPHWALQAAARLLNLVVPWAPGLVPMRDIQAACFRDPERVAEIGLDPHRYAGSVRLATALQLKAATEDIQAGQGSLSTPFLLVHGTADVVTSPRVSAALFAAAGAADKTLLLFEGGWHVLWWEATATRAVVLERLVAWVHARAPTAVARGLSGPPPPLPFAHTATLPTAAGLFREPGPLLPWTFKSHGRAGVPVVAGDDATWQPSPAAAATAVEEEGK